jgi:hypothetical protein
VGLLHSRTNERSRSRRTPAPPVFSILWDAGVGGVRADLTPWDELPKRRHDHGVTAFSIRRATDSTVDIGLRASPHRGDAARCGAAAPTDLKIAARRSTCEVSQFPQLADLERLDQVADPVE